MSKYVSLIVIGILTIGVVLRLRGAQTQFPFFMDQADDLFAVQKMADHIQRGELEALPLEGEPGEYPTQVAPEGSINHSVVFLYLLLPFAWLAGFDPYGVVVWFILLGIANIYLVYRVGKLLFGQKEGLIAAGLASISYWMIIQSRTIWPTTPVVFFVLLSALGLAYILNRKRVGWVLFVGAASIASQMHTGGYIYFLFIFIFAPFVWKRYPASGFWAAATVGTLVLPLVPFVFSDSRNEFIVVSSIAEFMKQAILLVRSNPLSAATTIVSEQVFYWIQALGIRSATEEILGLAGGILLIAWSVSAAWAGWRKSSLAHAWVGGWFIYFLFVPLFSFLYYGVSISRGTFSRLQFGLPFIFWGLSIVTTALFAKGTWGKLVGVTLLVGMVAINTYSYYWMIVHDTQGELPYGTFEKMAEFFAKDAAGRPYGIVEGNRKDVARAIFFIQLHQGLVPPSQINGSGNVRSWEGRISLAGTPPALTYRIFSTTAQDFAEGNVTQRFGDYVVIQSDTAK
jgi:hypothetical protein